MATSVCVGGGGGGGGGRRLDELQTSGGLYCAAGSTGPRCEVCLDDAEYFEGTKCVACPSTARAVGIGLAIGVGALGAAALVRWLWHAARTSPRSATRHRAQLLLLRAGGLGLRAKFKISLGFWQVWHILGSVYGVRLPSRFEGWLNAFAWADIDVPSWLQPCLGSPARRLLVHA